MSYLSMKAGRARAGAAIAVIAVSAGALGVWSTTAGAAVAPLPTFPDNLVVFPDRDFVTIEGFADRVGQEATIAVTRTGVGVVGSATGTVSGTDVAFEVNHPGGYCWGHGTGLNVTPDILPGDVVSISFGGSAVAATTVQDAAVDGDAFVDPADPSGKTVRVVGHIDISIDPANFEQRIIEPALVDTPVAKRDIRALVGPLTPAPKGGYSSGVAIVGETFTATYVFDDPAVAEIAANAGLGERAMTWELTDAAANRQGLTIAEFGEPGGPGMGGCPNGPRQTGPEPPTNIVAAVTSSGAIKVSWTPAVAIAGTPAIKGYRVTAVDRNKIGSEQVEIGKRIDNPAATGTVITGLTSPLYDVEVVSVSSAGLTFPAATATFLTDTAAPTVSASPVGGSYAVAQQVALSANEPGVDIYVTTDGTDPIDSFGGTGATAERYTGPLTVSADTTLKFAGFDLTGNASAIVTESYVITNTPTASATAISSATPSLQAVTVQWAAADAGFPGFNIAGYRVRAYNAVDATVPAVEVVLNGGGTGTTVTGLVGDQPYWFTVAARNDVNPAYGPESAKFGPVSPLGATVANAGPDQLNVTRGFGVTLTGAGSSPGGTYQWTQMDQGGLVPMADSNPNKVLLTGANSLNAGFTLPFFSFGMTNGPLYFQLTVATANGTKSDQVVITPRTDTVSIASARWKQNDFRVTGTGLINGAIITIRSATGQVYGTAVVTAGAFDLRLRNGAAPAIGPSVVYADSNMGGSAGPQAVAR